MEASSPLEGALDVAGHGHHLRGVGSPGAGRRHVSGAQAPKDRFPDVAMPDEGVCGRELGDAHAARGTLLAVTLHACLRENRAHRGVELVSLSTDPGRRAEHQACGRRCQKKERRRTCATASRRRRLRWWRRRWRLPSPSATRGRGRWLGGDQFHVRIQDALPLLGSGDQVMMPTVGCRRKSCPAVIQNSDRARFRQREVVFLGAHGRQHSRQCLRRCIVRHRI